MEGMGSSELSPEDLVVAELTEKFRKANGADCFGLLCKNGPVAVGG
jgi:hypothetical protein